MLVNVGAAHIDCIIAKLIRLEYPVLINLFCRCSGDIAMAIALSLGKTML